MSPIPQTSFLAGTFFAVSYSKRAPALGMLVDIETTGVPHLVRFLGPGKNRTMLNSY